MADHKINRTQSRVTPPSPLPPEKKSSKSVEQMDEFKEQINQGEEAKWYDRPWTKVRKIFTEKKRNETAEKTNSLVDNLLKGLLVGLKSAMNWLTERSVRPTKPTRPLHELVAPHKMREKAATLKKEMKKSLIKDSGHDSIGLLIDKILEELHSIEIELLRADGDTAAIKILHEVRRELMKMQSFLTKVLLGHTDELETVSKWKSEEHRIEVIAKEKKPPIASQVFKRITEIDPAGDK